MRFEGRGLGLPEGQVGGHPQGPGLPEKEQVRSDMRGPESLSPRTAPAPLVVPALLPQIQCKARRAFSSDSCWGRGSYTGPVPKEAAEERGGCSCSSVGCDRGPYGRIKSS